MGRRAEQQDFEVALGPHPARPNSRVLRVTYVADSAHDALVMAAIAALFPRPRAPHSDADRSEAGDE
jgi:hypothetical protein